MIPGTIDSDYRGEIGVILINHSEEDFKISNGERIAQLVLSRYEKITWEETWPFIDFKRSPLIKPRKRGKEDLGSMTCEKFYNHIKEEMNKEIEV